MIDKFTGEMRLCGTAALNLFLDKKTLDEPVKNVTDYYLNEGGHQIPIVYGQIPLEAPLSCVMAKDMRRSTCASLLVRIIGVRAKDRRRFSGSNSNHIFSTIHQGP